MKSGHLVCRHPATEFVVAHLGISRETAHQHCKVVFRAYGNIQRCNLIARVLFDGIASFPEMLRKQ